MKRSNLNTIEIEFQKQISHPQCNLHVSVEKRFRKSSSVALKNSPQRIFALHANFLLMYYSGKKLTSKANILR